MTQFDPQRTVNESGQLPQVDLDLNQGSQPADINAIGYTASRFPVKKVFAIAAVAAALVVAIVVLASTWVSSKLPDKPVAKAATSLGLEGSQGVNKPKLPDANTPLDSSAVAPAFAASGSGIRGSTSIDQSSGCPSTVLVDKRTGQIVRDAQGQSILIDCQGVIQNQAKVPAPAAQFSAAPYGQQPQPIDRYSGDTSLSRKNSQPNLSPIGSVGSIASLKPPVSASELEANLKKLLTPATATIPSAVGLNPILSGQTNAPANVQQSMGPMLNATATPKATAIKAFDPNLTIPKGDAINCAMTTRVVTEISGFTSCIVTEHVYSANGRVLLIERMAEIQGEYTAVGQPGQRRVYVLWSRVRKPGGITIDIASPSTDNLGAAGIDGIVDNRWFERIGSAYMLSIFKDFLAAKSAGSVGTNAAQSGTALYQNSLSTSNSLAEKVLDESMKIKPVVYAHQGERIAIFVARDLDFSGVYQVTSVPSAQQ